jgi:formylglycine-generating enzyme required for sulfatase activity
MKKIILSLITYLFLSTFTHANNLQIGSVTLSSAGGSQYLNFNISWSNSWRTSSAPFNWDAVWVFVKRRDCAGLQWRHANLAPQDSAHSGGSNLSADAYADKKGVMIYRSADGSGNITGTIKLKLDSAPAGNYDYQVFGIEMVYVPQGPFYLGDGASYNSFRQLPGNSPYLVNSENTITIGQDTGNLFSIYSGTPDNGLFPGNLPPAYPKGFQAFYVMKYEISQGQYANFLNNISQDAAANRYSNGLSGIGRYTISGNWPQLIPGAPDRACNFLSFQDLAAYLDWSALSPMTELEFEKICRGSNQLSVAGEMAWGGTMATDAKTIAAGTNGTPGEYVTDSILPGTGLASFYDGDTLVNGPLRCGFAAKNNSDRFRSGATYYGVMEMSGNLTERCYNLSMFNSGSGPVGGGFFTAQHGDGELAATPSAGYANAGWPIEASTYPYYEDQAIARKGGAYSQYADKMRVSDRFFSYDIGSGFGQLRSADYGGRGVSRRQQ